MVRIGTIGIGFMGWTHYQAIQRIRNAKLTAICTRNPKKLAGDWTMIQGNFGRRGEQVDLSKVNTYDDIDAFLADRDIDMVDICLLDLYIADKRRLVCCLPRTHQTYQDNHHRQQKDN